jgi:hypothetical protein
MLNKVFTVKEPSNFIKVKLKVGCLHPVACTRSGLMTNFLLKMVIRPKHVAVTE